MIAYTQIRQRAAFLSELSDRERDAWTELDSMAGPGRRLSDVEAQALRMALARASSYDRTMLRVSERLTQQIRATGLVEAAAFAEADRQSAAQAREAAICRPLGAG
jgi:hypothetical protein